MFNPYFCYAIAFSIALVMYPLGWSDVYPALSATLVLFLLLTITIHACLGMLFARKKVASFRKLPPLPSRLVPLYVTIFLYALWLAEFLHAGGIPFFHILLKNPFDYKLFGIPSLHVFIVTFSSFYTIFLFHHYLSNRSWWLLSLYAINLGAAILIYNRGMFLFNTSASVLLFLIYKGDISFRNVGIGITGAVLVSFFFGVMGTIRVSNESRVPYSNDVFLTTGQASRSFRESAVPAEFFWTYIYATSPLANVEQNMRTHKHDVISASSVLLWFNNEVLFDFISKRVNAYTGNKKAEIATIPGPFNATTVYAGSFSYLGFIGLALMALVIVVIPVLYLKLVPVASPFFLTGFVTLNTIFLFMVFDNTIRFTGLSFQMIYPILLTIGLARFPWLKKTFSLG